MSSYLITGAAGGMGQATARRLSQDGHRVIVTDVNERVEEVAAQIDGAEAIVADQGDADQVAALLDRAFELAGTLDGGLMAAGLTGTFGVESRTTAQFDLMMSVNARGTFLVAEGLASRMAARKTPGSIVLISSGAAFIAIGQVAYSASKAAVEGMANEFAAAYGEAGIRVNTIAPGLIDTGMALEAKENPEVLGKILERTPLGRLGTADEIASAVAFLLSDDAAYVSGTTLRVDGGTLST